MASSDELLDLYVIGGGINGTGIAADAAGRGLSVGLCEQDDLAGATSSASSKLIHGGLRYLEHYEFRLVREALREREVLLAKAPHIIWPLRFILPHRSHLRPAWMIRAGLFLYDHLSRLRQLPGSRGIRIDPALGLAPDLQRGFEYSDCWVDDARLVVLNAIQAREHGAEVLVRTRCVSAREVEGHWELTLEEVDGQQRFTRRARTLVNAAGPWVEQVIKGRLARRSRYAIRMIQGSHLVVPRLNHDQRAYILQHTDQRIVFVLPWENDFSLIGTTDRRYAGDPSRVEATSEEIDYLLGVVNDHFAQTLGRDDIIRTFAGVRPLCDDESEDPAAMTRDYTLDLDTGPDTGLDTAPDDYQGNDRSTQAPPLLSIFGGKITTYRKLAEAALKQLAPYLPDMGAPWTADIPLPGGDIPDQHGFATGLRTDYPFLSPDQAQRFARSYGTLCLRFLRGKQSGDELGEDLGAGLSMAELDYLIESEWARLPEDVLWRRTKLGMRFTQAQRERLAEVMAARQSAGPCDHDNPSGAPLKA